jgi:glycerol-3-phosphate responsive antiterminator
MTLNICKSIVTTLKSISQLFVIDSEKVKKGCLEIVDVNRVVCDVEPNVI